MISLAVTNSIAYNSAGWRYIGPESFSSTGNIGFLMFDDRGLLVEATGEGGACDDLVTRGDLEGPAPGEEVAGGAFRRRRGVMGEVGVCVLMSADTGKVSAIDVDIVSIFLRAVQMRYRF